MFRQSRRSSVFQRKSLHAAQEREGVETFNEMLVLLIVFVGVLGAYAVLVLTGLAVFAELDENDDPSDNRATSWSLRHVTAREGTRTTRA